MGGDRGRPQTMGKMVMGNVQDVANDYIKHFRESSDRFARYYHQYALENQADFERIDVEYYNILNALDAFWESNDILLLAATVKALDVYCDGRGYWQTLRSWLEIVWDNSHLIRDNELLFNIISSLAQLWSSQGERSLAYDLYQKAIELAFKLNRDDLVASAHLGFGALLLNIGEREKAIEVWRKARQFAEKAQDPVLIAGAGFYEELYSSTNIKKGDAIKDFTGHLFRNFGQEGEIGVLMLKATIMLDKGEFAEAEHLFRKALSIFQKSGEKQGEALAFYNLGIIANNIGDQEDAFLCFHNSLKLAEELGDQTGLTGIYYSLGLLHLQRNEFEFAREYLEKSVNNLRRDGDQKLLSEKLYWFGYALANSGEKDKALQVFLECQTLSRELGTLNNLNPEKEINTLQSLQNPKD